MEQLREIKTKYSLTGTLVVEYNGSNDEGWVGDVELASSDARQDVENAVYEILEQRYGGWEINEGSSGKVTIDFDKGTFKVSHDENVMSTRNVKSNGKF